RRVNADGNQLDVAADAVAEFLLDFAEGRGERRADGRAGGEDKIDGYGLAFHEVAVEAQPPAILVVNRDIGNLRRRVGLVAIARGFVRRCGRLSRLVAHFAQAHAALRALAGPCGPDVRVHHANVDDLIRRG